MRRFILTEELMSLPLRFEAFREREFKPFKEKVDKIEQDVGVLKQDVAILKQDVAALKGSDFERTVRERAPAYLGRLIRRCKGISFEDLADRLEDAVDAGIIREEEKEDALLVDAVVRGKLKTGKEVILAVGVSPRVDIEDIERAGKRAEIIGRSYGVESIGVAIGKDYPDRAKKKAEELNVVLV